MAQSEEDLQRIEQIIELMKKNDLAAIEIPELAGAPAILVSKTIPAGDYVCISQPGRKPDWDLARIYLYHTVVPKSKFSLAMPLEVEYIGAQRSMLIPVRVAQKGETLLPWENWEHMFQT